MNKATTTIGLLIILIALGTADALLTDVKLPETNQVTPPPTQPINQPSNIPVKQADIYQVLSLKQFTFQDTQEDSLLSMIIEDGTPVNTKVLIKDGDRSGFIAWVESSQVKVYFLSLKEALHSSFTPQIKDLIDETQRREGKPVRNLLSFFDPGISPERIVFVRVRNRLFEFHFPKEMDDKMFELFEELTN